MAAPNGLSDAQREEWNRLGPGYAKWVIEGRLMHGLFEKFQAAFLAEFADSGPLQVLDVATASGEPALMLASALPQAHVVATDIAEEFMAPGRARAEQAGLKDRVSFRVAGAQDLDQFADGSFDAVTCCLGVMLFPNYPRALSEFHRVLCPGGLLALAVWQSEARMPFMTTLRDFGRGEGPSTVPTGFPAGKFGDSAAELTQALEAAGFSQVTREEVSVTFELPADTWWEGLQGMPFPVRGLLAKLRQQGGEEALARARARLAALFAERGFMQQGGGISIPGNWCNFICARK